MGCFTEFNDNTPLTDELPMWFGAVFESSLYGAEPVFKSDQAPWVAFEVCLMPTEDVYFQEKEGMRNKLTTIKRALDGTADTIRADAFQKVKGLKTDMNKIHLWSEVAQEVLQSK